MVACKAVIKLFLKEIYVYVFTNKSINCVYIPRSSFCIFVVLSCIKGFKVVIYVFLAYLTFMTEVANIYFYMIGTSIMKELTDASVLPLA